MLPRDDRENTTYLMVNDSLGFRLSHANEMLARTINYYLRFTSFIPRQKKLHSIHRTRSYKLIINYILKMIR